VPRTAEHIAETHRIAHERVAAGKPAWEYTVDLSAVFHNEGMSFEEIRDAVVQILRSSKWADGRDEFDDLIEAIDGLAAAEDNEEFNGWFDEIYDRADYDRAWIKTH